MMADRFCHGNDLVTDMKALVRQKIMHIAGCVENGRYQNLIPSIEDTIEMMIQLSQFTDIENTLNLMEEALPHLNGIINLGADESSIAACPGPELEYHARGRPTFKIPQETLEFFLDNGFKVAEIARLIGVSKRTVERRLSENVLSVRQSYSQMTDEELEGEVNTIVTEYPHVGYRTVSAFLRSKGHRVQEKRIRHAMRNVDSCGVLFRRLVLSTSRIQRRSYSVTAPQALWHIDGNHKLIRWRFVIHGGIDGFSRLPVFLKISNNNRAETVLRAFIKAVEEYGLPRRVRSDKGSENILVAEYMFQQRGIESKPFIAGRSVHNQRIERLWRELWAGFTVTYYRLFHFMEEQHILDISNELHMQVLHFVFLPRMQLSLERLTETLKRRPLRTENNRSPLQLWVSGQHLDPEYDMQNEADMCSYGIDYSGPPSVTSDVCVEIPNTEQLSDLHIFQLNNILDQESDCFGVDKFQQALQVLQQ
ncbi:uncharacterized protein LOC134275702 isoform X2 [Saccostrea cucullata]|uniref:uncharacterized protein LOC134275702 isoform X2 n=1 Tax=Saccostrea cuccullata TaxID=36930 RepID=UPI002ED0A4F7